MLCLDKINFLLVISSTVFLLCVPPIKKEAKEARQKLTFKQEFFW